MKILEYTFKSEMALHARPTTMLISEASKFKSEIIIIKDDVEVNAKSLISVLSLIIEQGDKITIKIQGEDELEAAKSIEGLLSILEEE